MCQHRIKFKKGYSPALCFHTNLASETSLPSSHNCHFFIQQYLCVHRIYWYETRLCIKGMSSSSSILTDINWYGLWCYFQICLCFLKMTIKVLLNRTSGTFVKHSNLTHLLEKIYKRLINTVDEHRLKADIHGPLVPKEIFQLAHAFTVSTIMINCDVTPHAFILNSMYMLWMLLG